jgi:replicative DNA helicase
MSEEKNFGHLGMSFQQCLIKTIIEDKKYGETIIEVLESKYFDNNSFKYIMENLKEYFTKYGKIPDYVSIGQKIISENGESQSSKIHLDTLEIIKNNEQTHDHVKDTALNFCKQQNLKKELKIVQNIIENGQFESYNKIEQIIQKALQVGISGDEATDVFHDIDSALEKDHRHPLRTGIVGVDNLLNGGLGRGELGVVLAPTGTGKTTLLTKFANTAYNMGYNVLQIFFEDNPGNIKRKHYTIWSGIAPDDQPEAKEEVKQKVEEIQNNSKGNIKLLKLPSDNVTISEIKNKIRKLTSDGFKIDLLVLDYVDCISPERSVNGEEWKGEGSVMRSLESMTSEFDIAIWTATQGNRESISSEVVTGDQMGGSIKKAQIAHVILSIGKTLEQKEHNLATLTLLKSRIGKDGVIFQNCTFNNEYLIIDTDAQSTLLGHEEQKVQDKQARATAAYLKRQELTNKNK